MDEIIGELQEGIDYLHAAMWKMSQVLNNGTAEKLRRRLRRKKTAEEDRGMPHFFDHLADVMSEEKVK